MMRFLLDENLPGWWRKELLRHVSDLEVWRVGDPDAPPLQSSDPEVLRWCEVHDFILITNHRKSLPRHLSEHTAAGGHVPGIFVVDPTVRMDDLLSELVLIAGASLPGEYRDQIRYLPVT